MKISIIKKTKDKTSETVQLVNLEDMLLGIKEDATDGLITQYRREFLSLAKPERWVHYKRMPRVCPVAQFSRNRDKQMVFREYNGISVVKVVGLNNNLEIEKAKQQVSLLPQVMCAMTGADGRSLVVLTQSTLPDGTLPKTEEEALRHSIKAYASSVQCLQPLLEFMIDIEAPSLESSFLLTVDENPFVNAHPTPFIIDQPTEMAIKKLQNNPTTLKPLRNMMPGIDSYLTFGRMFDAAYMRALESMEWSPVNGSEEHLIIRVASECAEAGLPEEEVAARISFHFHEHDINDIRLTVHNVFAKCDGVKSYRFMSKHQIVAFRLREFLERRYEIRYNEVLQMTEFRERQSLRFLFRELSRSELNTIHHEALLEGIEPTFGEVDELVHSTFVKSYNPITEYLENLPKWDGKDRISEMAARVPTNNPYWQRLFRQWWLSMVAHWMNGDEQHANSTAPILIGAQGFRKSTFCRQLLPPELQMFYTDSIDFRSNIEAERSLSRFLLVNIDEFDQLSDRHFAFVKHLFQKPSTNIRRMYSEAIGRQRRYASFIGTTNCDEVLRDPTGNRRYLCVNVTAPIDTESPVDYAQLYAQAVELINQGVRYWINDEDEALIRETNGQFEVQSPLEILFLSTYSIAADVVDEGEGFEWMSLTDVMESLQQQPSFNRRRDNDIRALGRVLTKLSIPKHRTRFGVEYLLKKK